jgi:hypothetical protein
MLVSYPWKSSRCCQWTELALANSCQDACSSQCTYVCGTAGDLAGW